MMDLVFGLWSVDCLSPEAREGRFVENKVY